MKDKLTNKLQQIGFSSEDIDILIYMCRKHIDDIDKLYNYIIDNDITKRDDVTLYAMKLCGLGKSKIVIEREKEKY